MYQNKSSLTLDTVSLLCFNFSALPPSWVRTLSCGQCQVTVLFLVLGVLYIQENPFSPQLCATGPSKCQLNIQT